MQTTQNQFSVSGVPGGSITLSITERVVTYDPAARQTFYDGGWNALLPRREAMEPSKYKIQIPRGRFHFGEITAFNLLLAEGWDDAFYERVLLFSEPPSGRRARFRRGTEEFRAMIGHDAWGELRKWGDLYRPPAAKDPDLLAFRRKTDGSLAFQAVEVKVDDRIASGQLLGLALIERILKIPIAIWRLQPADSPKPPRSYHRVFHPSTVR